MIEPAAQEAAAHRLAAICSAGELCPGCRRQLPVRANRPNEIFAHWECAACRSPLTGLLVHDITPTMAQSIRIAQVHFDTRDAAPLPESMRELLKEFAHRRQQNHADPERRAYSPALQQLDVTVVPVGEHWTPRGKPLLGAVLGITSHGLGMVTSSLGCAGHVAMQIGGSSGAVQLLGRIAWTKDLGQGFQDSGVQFLLRFGPAPVVAESTRAEGAKQRV